MRIMSDSSILAERAFGNPFGGCEGFFPPFGIGCTQDTTTTTTSTTATQKTTKTEKAPPPTTKTTIIVSPTVVTSVVVVTSGNTITAGTTFTSGTTVTSVFTSAPPSTPQPTDTGVPTSGDPSNTSAAGNASSSGSIPASSDSSQPTAIPHQTITDTETSILSISPTLPPTQSAATPSTSSTVTPTIAPASSHRGMSTGLIAAICIACVSLIALAVITWIMWRKRAARRSVESAPDSVDPEDGDSVPHATRDVAEHSARISTTTPVPDEQRASPAILEHMEEKRDTISRYSDGGETASSPGSSTALSSFPLLSPGPITPTDAEPALAQMRSFRLAWDDPPPTPGFRPASLRSGEEVAAYRRSHGGDGYLVATTENCDLPRGSLYTAYLAREAGRSEVTLGQPPEYSRY